MGDRQESGVKAVSSDISIVVLNYNTRDLLADCLDSIYENINGLDYELIVVDNASQDGSASMVESRYPDACLIKNQENNGFSSGVNLGIKASNSDYVMVMNQDTLVRPGAFERMLEMILEDPTTGIVGPRLLTKSGQYQQSCNYFTIPRLKNALLFLMSMVLPHGREIFGTSADPGKSTTGPVMVDWVHGACMLVRREVFDKAGLFDENMFIYMEDMEFCYRAHQAGWKTVYMPDAEIIHYTNQSGIQTIGKLYSYRRLRLYISGIDYFLRKHFGLAHSFFTRVALACGCLAVSFLLRLLYLLRIFTEARGDIRKKIVYSQRMGIASLASLFGDGW